MEVIVLGSGTMGCGIAAISVIHGIKTSIYVRNKNKNQIIEKNIYRLIKLYIRRNRLDITIKNPTDYFNIINELQKITDDAASKRLIIEAINEDLSDKKKLITQINTYVNENDLFLTNTSSFSITELSYYYKYPSNFIGLHFFNPATEMQLVEINLGLKTSFESLDSIKEFVSLIGKKYVIIEDSPGFIVNRLLIPMINEAIILLENKVATKECIDISMKLGVNHPLGPLALADLIGLDVCLAIMENLHQSTGDDKYRASYLLKKMVKIGMLGKKSNEGFYKY